MSAGLPLVIVIPLLAAIGAFLLPRGSFIIALIGSLLTVGAVGVAAAATLESGALRHTIGGWRAPLGIDLVLDGFALLMLALTALIGLAITFYGRGYFGSAAQQGEKGRQATYFWALWMFLWAALNALFVSGDAFNLYVTLELLGFSAVALTALAGKPNVLKAAMRYLIVSLSGSLMYLMGVAFLYSGFGTLDIAQLSSLTRETPALVAAAALITAGLAMKTALFPLHFWLPPAHANAAAPVSALLSALVVKGSFYILLRLWLKVFFPLASTFVPHVISLLGVGAIIWGSVQAIRQTRLKLLIAYSTVAQLGYLFVLIPILAAERENVRVLAGVICFVLAHASAKAAAFLSAGNILHALRAA
jgi:multicomponent Na+:H+ antiporter subunit D